MSASQVQNERKPEKPGKPEKLNIFINQKKFEIKDGEMTPLQLLKLAGESPEEVVLALKEKGHLTRYENLDEKIPLRNGMHLVTMDTTPTPVS